MATNPIRLKMKLKQMDLEEVQAFIDNAETDEADKKVAIEYYKKTFGDSTPVPKASKKAAPKKAKEEAPQSEGTAEEAAKNQVTEYESDEQLTPEEKKRLAEAEKEFDERQKNRKTPSKKDAGMKVSKKTERLPRETKRQNLEESEEVPGLALHSKVTLKGEEAVGEVVRLYKSSDGKEKCMVKFGEDKPVKKRVTALELVKEEKPAPKKASPKKK